MSITPSGLVITLRNGAGFTLDVEQTTALLQAVPTLPDTRESFDEMAYLGFQEVRLRRLALLATIDHVEMAWDCCKTPEVQM